jgi:glucoside 3-dehydrogenase (cytochrome c) hitch-hiker subunit
VTDTPRSRVNRREALRSIAGGVGAASVAWVRTLALLARDQAPQAHAMVQETPASAPWTPRVLSAHEFATVGVLVDLILPATETPGAKAAAVDRYVDAVLTAADPADRDRFRAGVALLDRASPPPARAFVDLTPAAQVGLLTRFSESAAGVPAAGHEFFAVLKSMTITGYYTTEIGLRQELGDDGRMVLAVFEGCTHPEHQ